jgi:hypothetical protein
MPTSSQLHRTATGALYHSRTTYCSRSSKSDSTSFTRMHCFVKRSTILQQGTFPRSLFMTLLLIYHSRDSRMSVSRLLSPSRNTILCSTPSLFRVCIARLHWRCPKELSKMNRAISRCREVDGFLFDKVSFPNSSSRRHLFKYESGSTSLSPCFNSIASGNGGLASKDEGKGRKARWREASIL